MKTFGHKSHRVTALLFDSIDKAYSTLEEEVEEYLKAKEKYGKQPSLMQEIGNKGLMTREDMIRIQGEYLLSRCALEGMYVECANIYEMMAKADIELRTNQNL